jgi:hypothetical protein
VPCTAILEQSTEACFPGEPIAQKVCWSAGKSLRERRVPPQQASEIAKSFG